jgi:uncharacterized protein YebE (UPF0316 family)
MIDFLFSYQAWLAAASIFFLRVLETSLDTLRVLFVMRGRKGLVWIVGFFQSLVFVLAIASVISDLSNPLKILGYATGFATGNVVGVWIEEKLAIGHIHMIIVSSNFGSAIAEKIRDEGYAVTEIPARGRNGMVAMLSCSVFRRNLQKIRNLVNQIDDSAFITAEDVRPVRRGFWRA